MIKKLNVIHIVLEVLVLSSILVVILIGGFVSPLLFNTLLISLLLVHPMLYLVMMVIKEASDINYDTPKLAPVCMGLTILLGCLIWYLFYHLDHSFIKTYTLWYGVILLAFAIPMLICNLISRFKKEDEEKGPKFIKNGKR